MAGNLTINPWLWNHNTVGNIFPPFMLHPWKLACWIRKWRFGSDDFPFQTGDFQVSLEGAYYCWWFRNPAITTWDVENPANNGINYQPQLVIAGYQPSTVCVNASKFLLFFLRSTAWWCGHRFGEFSQHGTLVVWNITDTTLPYSVVFDGIFFNQMPLGGFIVCLKHIIHNIYIYTYMSCTSFKVS